MTAAIEALPIFYNQDVHGFYQKQKTEFHFQQKTDNEFLMFLLDTAVRVISIVQHLAPVIEAVSDASAEVDELDDMSPIPTPPASSMLSQGNTSGIMEVDAMSDSNPTQPAVPPLSAELEQINLEITNAQISSQPTSQPIQSQTIQSIPQPGQNQNVPVMQSVSQSQIVSLPQVSQAQTVSQPQSIQPVAASQSQAVSSQSILSQPHFSITQPQVSSQQSQSALHQTTQQPQTQSVQSVPPPVPQPQPVSSAQSAVSQNISTSQPSATQPIAEAPADSDISIFKSEEKPVPEVIEIKEEFGDEVEGIQTSASSNLLSPDTLQQLMSSISNNEENVGIQNFVTTATPSNLPPSFLDRSSTNPLSMLGSLNSGDSPGPSGLNVPNISESMMKNISDAGLNVSNVKGQANPRHPHQEDSKQCAVCSRTFPCKQNRDRHYTLVHLRVKKFPCPLCEYKSGLKYNLKSHMMSKHRLSKTDAMLILKNKYILNRNDRN